ncbi:uncharacterized protein BXZ73DRAFT_75924 [Epithele typhae]|uniref:uncharacterized protein n=1 Tax=Epithele typhae TaxID=378194 RepID=UPI00200771A6|nr:uncharacterized protein BXZ73DRAFT_75924 [Epithele typhae]KAH9939753.1 hypothetical protein BXZ73DRAFT_75924 [Epithele typhae]
MFALSALSVALAAAASVAGLPTFADKRATASATLAPSCDGLGWGAFDTQANFTVAALFVDSSKNTNTTGLPLVLGQAGATSGASFKVFSTLASYPFDQYPSISMEAGRLIPTGPNVAPAAGMSVLPAAQVSFISSNSVDPTKGAQIYCGVASTDPAGGSTGHPQLAVNGDTDNFSLCLVGTQNNVVYKHASGQQYNDSSCEPVRLQMIFPM